MGKDSFEMGCLLLFLTSNVVQIMQQKYIDSTYKNKAKKRDKTMAYKLMYIPDDETQNYIFCLLN